MYDVVKDVINEGTYELVDILNKINKLWVESVLSEEQRDELVELARSKAVPDNSYAENKEQINLLWRALEGITTRVTALEKKGGVEPPTVEEYPEYVQPTGAHDTYNTGDKVTFQGKKYICKMDNCVWDPLVYPDAWEATDV